MFGQDPETIRKTARAEINEYFVEVPDEDMVISANFPFLPVKLDFNNKDYTTIAIDSNIEEEYA